MKYEISIEDVSPRDQDLIRSNAIRLVVDTKINEQVPAVIKAYENFLTAQGYKIVKVKNDEQR